MVQRAAERYLRTDLPCGYAGCAACASFGTNPLLKVEEPDRNAKFNRHVLIVDATSLIRFYDLFDSPLLR